MVPVALLLVARAALWMAGGGYYAQPSGSMEPALPLGSAYVALPLADAVPPRGTIIVFQKPGADHVDYVKRVIALPNERIAMKDGAPVINGRPVSRERVQDARIANPGGWLNRNCNRTSDGSACLVAQWRETLPGGRVIMVRDWGETPADSMAEMTVPVGHVFVLGDNRDNSVDSRFKSIGAIPIDRIRSQFWMFVPDLSVAARGPDGAEWRAHP